ncbi:MAG: hypothetical protein A2Y48_08840 [Nitrospirae bacterium RIFCSPLOW2_12_42_9]|nr:MAG: hypothetical protein A2035_07520 [Nitrospirae bacterium GWA2_42_11]OGW53841.1 MAG: hypothetical protein A2Z60_01410 [Nitrospirae bacterium RIFCSPLOWO2_02_42_7]OGW55574.1 MAG: hypothetical protein A3D21_01325 [Nitrospirae bacterium RIFCSPHIGHO2_02_FULL_42_12]OGW56938.1 MAG: hypothetical protein A2Y48_08840 [Nitrospirae bacterium RIFCSPLOW2_12_42_9]HAS17683.1 DNA-binding response regulator [Nitrospiraceae bacterium]
MENKILKETVKEKVSILIVDDHTLFRQGLRRILESEESFEVMGEAADGNEAIKMAKALNPKIILMDISMPHLNGIDATHKIKRQLPDTYIILLTMHEDLFLVDEGLKMGASGYVLKKSVDREMIDAIFQVRCGQTYMPTIHTRAEKSTVSISSYDDLSLREKEILRMLANGMTNKEISEYLCISINTVETHRKNLMKKLKLHNLSEIIKYSMIHGIIQK